MIGKPFAVVVSIVLTCIQLAAGAEPPAATQPDGKANRDDVRIESGDLLKITIPKLFTDKIPVILKIRVDAEGKIPLPYIDVITAKGTSVSDLEKTISKAYDDAKILRAAAIEVARLESAADASVKLGPIERGNFVTVRTYGLVDASNLKIKTQTVSDDGTIKPPWKSEERVKVQGLSEQKATELLMKKAKEAHLNVLISVLRVTAEKRYDDDDE